MNRSVGEMAGVWSKLSDLWEFRHTEGEHCVVPRGKSINASRQKLRNPEPSKRVYEEVALEDVLEDRDHIVVYNHGMNKISDSDVPELAKKASQWDSVTQFVPGFTAEMLVVADMMYRVEYFLTKRLNTYLEAEGLAAVDHAMQAVNRSKMKDKFLHKNEKKALKVALKNFFTAIGGNNISWEVLMSQWAACRDWQCRRVTVAHPLEHLGSLEEVKSNISREKGYAAVREIALVMVDVAMENDSP